MFVRITPCRSLVSDFIFESINDCPNDRDDIVKHCYIIYLRTSQCTENRGRVDFG